MQNQHFSHLIMYIWDSGGPISRQSVKKGDSVMFFWAASVKIQEKHAIVDFTPTVMSHFCWRPFTLNAATFPGSLPPCCEAELRLVHIKRENAGEGVEEVGWQPVSHLHLKRQALKTDCSEQGCFGRIELLLCFILMVFWPKHVKDISLGHQGPVFQTFNLDQIDPDLEIPYCAIQDHLINLTFMPVF